MPIYEYKCNNCGNCFESLRSVQKSDDPIECNKCSSSDSKRMLSTFFAHGSEKTPSTSQSGCSSCAGGSCSSCRH